MDTQPNFTDNSGNSFNWPLATGSGTVPLLLRLLCHPLAHHGPQGGREHTRKLNACFRVVLLASCWAALSAPLSSHGQPSTNRSQGPKSVLCIRLCYPDDIAEPIREAEVHALMEEVSEFLEENSYGATWLTNVTVTPVLLMPYPKSHYSHGFPVTDVWDVAAQAGYYRTNYDFDSIFSADVGFGRNTSNGGTGTIFIVVPMLRSICHELGHVYGVPHSDGWFARGGSIIGPGQEIAYGNPFDTMGAGYGHFNTCFKGHLEWLAQAYIQDVTSSGVYRIHQFDVASLTNGRRYALRILRSDQLPEFQRYYWLELRQQPTNNPSIRSGPLLFCGPGGTPEVNQQVVLLDTTPDYSCLFPAYAVFMDAALRPCHTFSDTALGIHITAMPKNEAEPEWVDIRVNLGFFTNNHPPTVVITPTVTNLAAGEAVGFSANAMDPDSDELVYAWDFGDGRSAFNQLSVTQSWFAAGEFVVRCAVSDMKGGTASAAVVVRVGDPMTSTIAGSILANGQPLEGVRVSISPSRSTLTSSDGTYTLAGLANGHYRLLPMKPYYEFSPTCMNLAVSNQNLSGANFVAMATATPNSAPLVHFAWPPDGWILSAGTNLDVVVECYADGPITNVMFYDGTNFLGAGRYGITVSNVSAGQHLLRAVATNDLGLWAHSADVELTAVTGPPANDAFADRIALSGPTVSVVGHNVCATAELGEPASGIGYPSHSVWYSWLAPSNGLFAVITGDSPVSGTQAGIFSGSTLTNLVRLGFSRKMGVPWPAVFMAVEGVAYPIAVDGAPGTVAFGIRPAHPPANDDFTNRTTIVGVPITVTGSTLDATLENGDPLASWEAIGSTWWSWTAPDNGTFTISAEGVGYLACVAIYTGSSLQNLTLTGAKGFPGRTIKAVAGTTYQIETYAVNGCGDVTLRIRRANPPPNDDFANRISLTGGVAVAYGSNLDATRELGEPKIAWRDGGTSIWWSWTAPFGGRFVVVADGPAAYLLGIYTGSTVSNLALVAEKVYGGITFQPTPGTPYQIAADGYWGTSTPSIRLRIFPETPRLESVSLLSNGALQLALAAEPSQVRVIEASDDLWSWIPVMTNWSYTSSVLFTNLDPLHFEQRFYRAVSP